MMILSLTAGLAACGGSAGEGSQDADICREICR